MSEMKSELSFKADAAPAVTVPCFKADDLLGNCTTAKILLDEKTYVLRLTRQNKLILTK